MIILKLIVFMKRFPQRTRSA